MLGFAHLGVAGFWAEAFPTSVAAGVYFLLFGAYVCLRALFLGFEGLKGARCSGLHCPGLGLSGYNIYRHRACTVSCLGVSGITEDPRPESKTEKPQCRGLGVEDPDLHSFSHRPTTPTTCKTKTHTKASHGVARTTMQHDRFFRATTARAT